MLQFVIYTIKNASDKKVTRKTENHKCVLEMVCKEDVVSWFQALESYKRIDTMYTLLNACLPFELRFLGTCLEELGNLDSSTLRGIELRVNNSAELASEITACQFIEPSDMKVRRKMALYLAMIRACNRPCVMELFTTLIVWGNHAFIKLAEGDALHELLLVYIMAANHPVFSFDQRMKCGEIFNRIVAMGKDTNVNQTIQDTAYDKLGDTLSTQNKTPGTNTFTQSSNTNIGSTVASNAKPLPQSTLPYSIAPTLAEQSLSLNVMSQLGFEPSAGTQVSRLIMTHRISCILKND